MSYVFTMNNSTITISLSSSCPSVSMPLHDPVIINCNVCHRRYFNDIEYIKRSNNSSINNGINIINNISCDSTTRSHNDNIQVIVYPKFSKQQDDEISAGFDTFDAILNIGKVRRSNANSSVKIKNQDIILLETRDIESKVCKAVNKLMNHAIVKSEGAHNSNESLSVVEWVTVKELYQEITKLMQLDNQNVYTKKKVLKSKSLDELNKRKS